MLFSSIIKWKKKKKRHGFFQVTHHVMKLKICIKKEKELLHAHLFMEAQCTITWPRPKGRSQSERFLGCSGEWQRGLGSIHQECKGAAVRGDSEQGGQWSKSTTLLTSADRLPGRVSDTHLELRMDTESLICTRICVVYKNLQNITN